MKPTRDEPPRPAWLPVLLSGIAGLGHLVIGRSRRGLVLFVLATSAWNLALLSVIAPSAPLGSWTAKLGLAAGIFVTVYALFDIWRIAVYARWPRVRQHREDLLRQGITHYLRHDFPKARRCLDQILDIDPADPVARLYLASLERRAAHHKKAIHHARRALGANPRNPFHPEIEREIALAKEALG